MFLLLEIKEALIKMKIKKHIKLNKTIKSWKSILNYLKCVCVCVCVRVLHHCILYTVCDPGAVITVNFSKLRFMHHLKAE